jgi:NADH oxidase (H2O-forming)
MSDNEVIDITPGVKWIGVRDYDIRTFDIVMNTEYGTTYNSYFINSEYKAIIEVAKEKFFDEYLAKLKSVTTIEDIKYIVLNHTEPDHSGSLKLLLDLIPSAIVVGSGNAIRYLEGIVNAPFKSLVVKDGDKLDLGDKTLEFISAPNLHWPDSIFTYLVEDKVLFTCDSFGAHYCSPELYSDFSGNYFDSFKYYFDIIMKPFSRFMLKAIEKIKPLDIEFVCPGHGPIHHKNISEAIKLSEKLAREYVELTTDREHLNILIAYVSAYGYTKEAAGFIASGILENNDLTVEVVDIENSTAGELDALLTRADGIILGSPTINQNTLQPVYNLFALINPIRDKGKLGGAFGSYGWSGESTKIIIENFRLLKLKVFEETAQFKFHPGGCKQDILVMWGRKFAKTFVEECGHKKNPGV